MTTTNGTAARTWRGATIATLAFTLVTGLAYSLLITALAQLVLPQQANGSMIARDGKLIGSELVGQQFASAHYFWPRPSATGTPYDAAASGGSNLGPTNSSWTELVEQRRSTWQATALTRSDAPPVDLLTASGSGLDPHISPEAARFQAARVAAARGWTIQSVLSLIDRQTESPAIGLLGPPRVNVLRLNLTLDQEPNPASKR